SKTSRVTARTVALLVACPCAVAFAAAAADSGASGARVKEAELAHFDSHAAWRLVRKQVAVGQRPAGSQQLRKLAGDLRALLPGGRFEQIPHQPRLRNVVGTIPGRRPGIVIGAHYDTLVKPKGFVGANN